ncbi:chromate transporter [Fervidibacillus albus]|uniref:Chromate transporter n=1 Tax=Fervidibacillus albus TaxID=2980026 RepID=A0A9E8LUB5_9BACI|nr:chromate transporter [Fervidibacillus albus]WAA09808.1 chromate transporter [Fervidibacillus albus]
MIYWKIFLAFFIPGILGYGGGPGTIPLVEKEVVDRYGWMDHQQFSEMIALGNALPGPIATKMAGYIGFMQGGVLGSVVALVAIVAPTLILMIGLLSILQKYKDSPKVKQLSQNVRPVIAVLLGVLTYDFLFDSFQGIGGWQTLIIAVLTYFFLELRKVHPAYVIIGALVYGALFLG